MATVMPITSHAPAHPVQRDTTLYRVTGALLVLQFVLQYVTLGVLGTTINWPASLDEPASVALPLVVAQSTAVAWGYTSYFVSALLLIPIALLMHRVLAREDRAMLTVATGFGVLAGFAKILGIGRWLFLMPALATAYIDPQASTATRDAIAVAYEAFNNYAGGVGEILGVTLLAGIWTALLSFVLLRSAHVPRWIGYFGLVAALLLVVGAADVYGVELGPILIVQGVVWQFWMLALGVRLLRARST
jgi:hypothetical protein